MLEGDAARVLREETNGQLFCKPTALPQDMLNPQSAGPPDNGTNAGVYRLEVTRDAPGTGWGVLGYRTGDAFGAVDKRNLVLWQSPSCDATGFTNGAEVRIALPTPLELDRWPSHPRGADGTVYAPSTTHLVAIRPNTATVDDVISWADVAALIGLPPGASFAAPQRPGAVMTPSGELFVLIGHTNFRGVVAVAPNGDARIVFGADPSTDDDPIEMPSEIHWDPTIDAAVITGAFAERLTFTPLDPTDPLRPPQIATGRILRYGSLEPVQSGTPLFLNPVQADVTSGRCAPSGQLLSLDDVDVDSDGLFPAQEVELGTSIVHPDSDGDGALDGTEHVLFATAPTSATSAPPVAEPGVYAPSTLIADWDHVRFIDPTGQKVMFLERGLIVGGGPMGVVCSSHGCRNAEGELLGPFPPSEEVLDTAMTRDGAGYFQRKENGDIVYRPWDGPAETIGNASSMGIPEPFWLHPLTPADLYVRTLEGVFRLVDGELLQISAFRTARPGCPVVANDEELATCGAPELAEFPELLDAAGYDDEHDAFWLFGTEHGEPWIGAVTSDGRTVVVPPRAHQGDVQLANASFHPLPGGGGLIKSTMTDLDGNGWMQRLDAMDGSYRSAAAPPLAHMFNAGPWFGEGHYSPLQFSIASSVNEGANCGSGSVASSFGSASWDFCSIPDVSIKVVNYDYRDYAALWVPTTANPVAGEGILVGRAPNYSSLFGLWRLGPRGQVFPWIVDEQLTELSNGAFGDFEIGSLGQVASAPDRSRLCLVTADPRGVWELSLDAEHAPVALARVDAGEDDAVDCGYSDDGELLVLRESPPRIDVDGAQEILLPFEWPRGLFVVGGRVIATGAGWSRCVDLAAGTSHAPLGHGTSFADGPDGTIAVVGADTEAFLIDPADHCDELPAGSQRESFDDVGLVKLFQDGMAEYDLDGQHLAAERTRIVMTESGIAYVVTLGQQLVDDPLASLDAQASGPWTRLGGGLTRWRPKFNPSDCATRITSLDPQRREDSLIALGAPWAEISAMTVLGRGPLRMDGDDWIHRGIDHTPKEVCGEIISGAGGSGGAGAGGGGGGDGSASDGDGCACDCATAARPSGPSLPALAVGALALVARRRRSRRPRLTRP